MVFCWSKTQSRTILADKPVTVDVRFANSKTFQLFSTVKCFLQINFKEKYKVQLIFKNLSQKCMFKTNP